MRASRCSLISEATGVTRLNDVQLMALKVCDLCTLAKGNESAILAPVVWSVFRIWLSGRGRGILLFQDSPGARGMGRSGQDPATVIVIKAMFGQRKTNKNPK
jgi:hypothetical protein